MYLGEICAYENSQTDNILQIYWMQAMKQIKIISLHTNVNTAPG